MNLGQAWRTLGIARTQDATAIRRAYAAKLKALDLDSDTRAYADLRTAREIALRWAAGQQAPAAEESVAPADDDASPPNGRAWPYAAPLLPGATADPALTAIVSDEDGRPYIVLGPDLALRGEVRELPLPGGDPFAVPALAELPADTALIQPDRGRDIAFYNLLFPDGEQSDEALVEPDLTRALGHFHALLRQAQGGALALSEATDAWLCDTLARAWPRSAPFVGEAAAAFGWERQAGLLGERPTIAFLNARLKGMRFHEKVLQPDHELHKAWIELLLPGRASWFHRTRLGGARVEQLIAGVRQRFPELETYWDGERVASWESSPKSASEGGPGIWIWLLIGIGVVRLLASAPDDQAVDAKAPPQYLLDDNAPVVQQALDDVAQAIFGPDMGMVRLEQLDPGMARELRGNLSPMLRNSLATKPPAEQEADLGLYIARMQNMVRPRLLLAGKSGDYADLRKVMELRFAYLVAARKLGTVSCMRVIRRGDLPEGAVLDSQTLADEQRLAAHFVETARMNPPPHPAGKASVPGAIVAQAVKETRLSPDTVGQVMRGEGTDEEHCKVHIALLRAVLKNRKPEDEAILRVL